VWIAIAELVLVAILILRRELAVRSVLQLKEESL
jgi:hypothetical protein